MVFCPSCSADNSETSKFCSECGGALGRQYGATVTHAVGSGDSSRSSLSDSSHHGRFLPGTKVADRYRIVSLVGKGGMGEVYRADDLKLGHTVALKFLPQALAEDSQRLEYFHSEVRLTRQISHPNVCRVYDIGEADGQHFLSMEYIDGEDLRVLLRRIGRLPSDKGVDIAQQLCAGLAAAHDQGVLHRDLKPANIMIDGRGSVRVTDFGLATMAAEATSGTVAGTPAYMAPEQLAHGEATIQSDLYSLGLVLFELFTGKAVYNSSDPVERSREDEEFSETTLSPAIADLDPAVKQVILACLKREPTERPASARIIAAELPGGDPLAAAIAAGRTPSPELVANARGEDSLHPSVAFALLFAIVILLSLSSYLKRISTLTPERSPGVLSVLTEQILAKLGYGDLPNNSAFGFNVNYRIANLLQASPRNQELAEQQTSPPIQFWRRWTWGAFIVDDFHAPELRSIDGATTEQEGHATVILDSSGRLLGLTITPRNQRARAEEPPADVDWSILLHLMKLDHNNMRPTQMRHDPPIYCDQVIAWQLQDDADESVIVQAGAVQGKPNYLEIVGLAHDMTSHGANQFRWQAPVPLVGFTLITIFFMLVVIAWRNVKSSRGDRRGAFRVSLIFLGLCFLVELFSIRPQSPTSLEQFFGLFTDRAAGHILLHVTQIWVIYIAVEPYVRRFWPHTLVGTVRLLEFRVLDPNVGQEVLVGTFAGSFAVFSSSIVLALLQLLSITGKVQLPIGIELGRSLSPNMYIATTMHALAAAMVAVAICSGILVVLRLLCRSNWVAIIVGFVIVASLYLTMVHRLDGRQSALLLTLISAIHAIVIVLVITRVGILAAFITLVVIQICSTPLPFDVKAWYGPYGIANLTLILLLAGYGSFVSLGGVSVLGKILDEPKVRA